MVHADLYRVSHAGELAELGVDEAAETSVVLLEWPDRAADSLPGDRLDISFTLVPHLGANQRNAELIAHGAFVPRLERMTAMRQFLADEGLTDAKRSHLQGDASTRAYERIAHDGRKYVLMNAPRRPDGPPVRGGLPYSAIAHLAEDVKPFVAMARALRDRGLSAPLVYAANLNEGLLLLEDLGSEAVVEGDPPAPIEERYAAAVDVLVEIHRQQVAFTLPVTPGVEHRLPPYDLDAFLIEAELLLDWYLPHRGTAITGAARTEFTMLWRDALSYAETFAPTWVMRDYHSPNLLWLPDRDGIKRVGLLDFQDALMGPAPYDLVSLLQDARVDVPDALEIALLGRYVKGRLEHRSGFRHHRLRAALRHARCAARDEDSRDLRAARQARRQTAIPASHAADMALSPPRADPSRHERSQSLVRRPCVAARGDAMRAMVLAAGLGTRMRPLTDTLPKPLVKVAGHALLDHVLDRLADAGVETAVVNVHHMADQIENHLKGRTRPKIAISDERGELLDTGGGVVKALTLLGTEPFLHMNSDTLWIEGVTPNLPRLAASFDPARMDILLLLALDHRQHRLRWARRFHHGAGRTAVAPCRTPSRAVRLCGRRDAVACAVRECAGGQILAQHDVRPRHRGRAAVRAAARRNLDACRDAGRHRGRRSGDFRKCGLARRRPI